MNNSKEKNNESWVRRCILSNHDVSERVEMYESIGFEVMVKDIDPEKLPEEYCKECYFAEPEKYKILYTRKKGCE